MIKEIVVDCSTNESLERLIEETASVVPQSVTPLQARRALDQLGLLDDVEALVVQMPRSVALAWEYAIEFCRDDETLCDLAQQLGLSDEQVDDVFILAATL